MIADPVTTEVTDAPRRPAPLPSWNWLGTSLCWFGSPLLRKRGSLASGDLSEAPAQFSPAVTGPRLAAAWDKELADRGPKVSPMPR